MRTPLKWLRDFWAALSPSPHDERLCIIRIVDRENRTVFECDTKQLYFMIKYGYIGEWADLIGPTMEPLPFRILAKAVLPEGR